MKKIDLMLDNLVKEVELYGRSAADSIFLSNLSFLLKTEDYDHPLLADKEGAIVDFQWFLNCSREGMGVPHQDPNNSFWLKTWGKNADAYGTTWNFESLVNHLNSNDGGRRAILFNPYSPDAPPCILSYQCQFEEFGRLDITVNMRSSDVCKVLPQDVMMTRLLLEHISRLVRAKPGHITFNIGNAHVYWEDCMWQEEYSIDYGL